MAKTSKIVKNRQRQETVARYATRRVELKATISGISATAAEKAAAQLGLQRLPRDASPTRVRRRDVADGRPGGHLRAFGLSRIRFREMAHAGELPGIRTSSW